jgi:hypothetical protein
MLNSFNGKFSVFLCKIDPAKVFGVLFKRVARRMG